MRPVEPHEASTGGASSRGYPKPFPRQEIGLFGAEQPLNPIATHGHPVASEPEELASVGVCRFAVI